MPMREVKGMSDSDNCPDYWIDIIELIKTNVILKKDTNKYLKMVYFDKIRLEYRNEKLFMLIVLYFSFMRKKLSLENIL